MANAGDSAEDRCPSSDIASETVTVETSTVSNNQSADNDVEVNTIYLTVVAQSS